MSGSSLLLVVACVLFTCSSAQKNCKGRCGETYYRGHVCHCDYECLSHNECCKNYESVCTTKDSCKGRCGEGFKRGRQCNCDTECVKYNQCCPDYETQCTLDDTALKPESAAASPQGTASLCLNSKCNKPAECSTEEDTTEPEVTTSQTIPTGDVTPKAETEDYDPDPEESVTTDATPLPDAASGSEPVPSDTSGEKPLEPVEIEPALLPEPPDVETELNEDVSVTEPAENEENIFPVPTELTTAAPNITISSTLPASQPPAATTGNTEEEPESTQSGSEPEVQNTFAMTLPPERASTWPATTQWTSDQPPEPTSPTQTAQINTTLPSGKPVQNDEPNNQSPETTPTSTVQPNNPDTDASNSTAELNPANLDLPTDWVPPEDIPGPQPEPSEVENHDTDEPSTNGTAMKNGSSDDLSFTPASVKSTPSGEVSLAPTKAPEQPTEPMLDANTSLTESTSTTASPKITSTTVKVNPSPTKAAEKPSEPKLDANDTNLTDSVSTTASPRITTTTVKVSPPPTKAAEKPTKPKLDDSLDDPRDYQADANNDTNLCSGRPVNGLTTLRNGTIVVFRGHYFWTLDSRRTPGPAQTITDIWGIPSPIDTVYTRCNCQGKTYFFKGSNYWRFENDVMDRGFPKTVSAGFGLGGQITAALSMPQYRSRKESVFFFKTGGLAQRYTYRVTPQCGSKLAVYTARRKVKRQADPELGPEIDIMKSWRGFPSSVTSAVSVPSTGRDGHKYYIFSRTKYYSLKMEGNTPVILTPRDGPGKQKSAKSWFRCPETRTV